jgi:glutathione S-transferase
MKLYYAPGACSIGIHTLLEEIGKPYEAVRLDIRAGDTQKPPFIELNPKGKVPTLQRDDGRVITEYPVIAHYLAKANPEAKLLPRSEEAELTAAEAMDYCVATIHMQGFSRLFRPANFAPNEADHEAVKARGRELVEKGYALMDRQLAGKEWIAGEYSIADSALFYVEFWGGKRMGMQLPPNLAAHLERMLARPAVQRMLEQEGLKA